MADPKRKTRTGKNAPWPKGLRRNEDGGEWSRTLLRLQGLLDDHWQRGVVSLRVIAAAVGADERTVRRWLDSTDRPAVATQALVATWCDLHAPRRKPRAIQNRSTTARN